MRVIKLIFIITLILPIYLEAQSNLTEYHLKGKVVQVNQYNPAEVSESKINLSLPFVSGVGLVFNNFASFDDILALDSENNLYRVRSDNVLDKIALNGQSVIEADVNLFYFGFVKQNGWGFNIYANTKFHNTASLPSDMLNVIFNGTGDENLGSTFNDGFKLQTILYSEVGLGIQNGFFNNKLRLGVHLKYLMGHSYGKTLDDFNIEISTNEDTYETTIKYEDYGLDGLYSTNGMDESTYIHGQGFSFDIGGVYNLHDFVNFPVKVSFALNDIFGMLYWTDINRSISTQETITLDSTIFRDDGNVEDLLDRVLPEGNTTKIDVDYKLPPRMLFSVNYELSNRDIFNLSNMVTFYNIESINSFAFGYTRALWEDKLSLTGNLTKQTHKEFSFGLGASLQLGMVQLYFATNNFFSLVNLTGTDYFDFRGGLNFTFNPQKMDKRQLTKPAKNLEWDWDKKM